MRAVPTGYSVRRACAADLPALPAVERAANRRFAPGTLGASGEDAVLGLDVHRQALTDGWLWVAESPRGDPVGFALAMAQSPLAFLAEVDVLPDHGRRGLGRALVQAVVSAARQRGFARLALTTFAQLPFNAPMYERLGFARCPLDQLPPTLAAVLLAEADQGQQGRVAMVMDLQTDVRLPQLNKDAA